jgi:hypothetical protein
MVGNVVGKNFKIGKAAAIMYFRLIWVLPCFH